MTTALQVVPPGYFGVESIQTTVINGRNEGRIIPLRIPRDICESTNWRPDYRAAQVYAYLDCWRLAEDYRRRNLNSATAAVPAPASDSLYFDYVMDEQEDDELIKQYFIYHLRGDRRANKLFFWADECLTGNNGSGYATRIKAMVLAGKGVEEISRRLKVPVGHIETFLALHFDIQKYISEDKDECADFVAGYILPFVAEAALSANLAVQREQMLMLAAFSVGWDVVRPLLNRSLIVSQSLLDQYLKIVKCSTIMRAAEFCISNAQRALAGPAAQERLNLSYQSGFLGEGQNKDPQSLAPDTLSGLSQIVINNPDRQFICFGEEGEKYIRESRKACLARENEKRIYEMINVDEKMTVQNGSPEVLSSRQLSRGRQRPRFKKTTTQ